MRRIRNVLVLTVADLGVSLIVMIYGVKLGLTSFDHCIVSTITMILVLTYLSL